MNFLARVCPAALADLAYTAARTWVCPGCGGNHFAFADEEPPPDPNRPRNRAERRRRPR